MLRFYEDGAVGLRDPYTLSYGQWEDIAGCATMAGYGIEDADMAESIYSELARMAPGGEYKFNNDMASLLREKYGISTKEENERAEDVAEAAERYFGRPYSLKNAGWLTVNGEFLDFSSDGYQRDIDHRDIRLVLDECGIDVQDEPGSNVAAMIWFMDRGNIRLMNNGADISECPNAKEWTPFERYLCSIGGTVYIDLSVKRSGARIATLEYQRNEIPFIRNDIIKFFETGIYPRERKV